MTFDIREDKRQLDEWLCADEPKDLDLNLVAYKLINGFERCEDYCSSRNNCGEDGCYCIRANFPTPKHYETYKQMMPDASKVIALRILSVAFSNQQEENYGKGN